jgi:aspartyl-tRNA(Asn)/glutamyl-tRNA(Gln) amidotransferase subunit C
MPVTIKDVEHVARLARLEFSESEKEKLTLQLNEILTYVEKLNELDTSNVEPLSHVIEPGPGAGGTMREDEVKPSLSQEEALRNAPDRTDKFFKVPKVIG